MEILEKLPGKAISVSIWDSQTFKTMAYSFVFAEYETMTSIFKVYTLNSVVDVASDVLLWYDNEHWEKEASQDPKNMRRQWHHVIEIKFCMWVLEVEERETKWRSCLSYADV